MDHLIDSLASDFPQLNFVAGERFCWSPDRQQIIFRPDSKALPARWALLHELGHALLGHHGYDSDFELLILEVAAWHKAETLAARYGLKIAPDHIQDCLDSYRDWLHRRSSCPACGNRSLPESLTEYRCFGCHASWRVSASRFCRAYRQHVAASSSKKSPVFQEKPTTFR